jgi:hypothetical protein
LDVSDILSVVCLDDRRSHVGDLHPHSSAGEMGGVAVEVFPSACIVVGTIVNSGT